MMMAKTKTKFLLPLILLLLFYVPQNTEAQLMNHYWAQSYNSISTLLSGAVVGEGSGNAAIYYNPSAIVDLEDGNNLSVAASIFTYSIYSMTNIMGNGNDVVTSSLVVQPQFLSYGVKSPFKKWSFEVAVFSRIREDMNLYYAGSKDFTLQTQDYSENRLNQVYSYENYYSDSWVGIGGGYKYSDRLSLGISANISVSYLKYKYMLSSTVYPLYADTTLTEETALLAQNELSESINFTNIRIITKLGATYKLDKISFGLNINLPAMKLFSVGKKTSKGIKEMYNNLIDPGNTRLDYYVFDSQSGKQLKTNFKLPFSIALGSAYSFGNNRKIFFTAEYFAAIGPYKLVEAQLNTNITTDIVYDQLKNKNWLTYDYRTRAVLNIAIGSQWEIKENLLLLMGFRTDFNGMYRNDLNEDYLNTGLYLTTSNNYHLTGGVKFNFKKHLLIAGTQFTYGHQNNLLQVSNFESVDKFMENKSIMPLMGERKRIVGVNQFSISVFLGATLNFESKAERVKK